MLCMLYIYGGAVSIMLFLLAFFLELSTGTNNKRMALETFDACTDCLYYCLHKGSLSANSSKADVIYLENWIPGSLHFGKMHLALAILHGRAVLPTKKYLF